MCIVNKEVKPDNTLDYRNHLRNLLNISDKWIRAASNRQQRLLQSDTTNIARLPTVRRIASNCKEVTYLQLTFV
ncbi:hypothetical protein L1987_37951 [Smallanthus sonchifolius]|uniref:Uncharacterized protein n=1 Tax=Smallanthus sonchifolius TaxID=185202 RepID=A0ACB9HHU8_9ASTR|nr:hypothetical protein L1987_37951 [Smallanthus sonchifolius]